MKKILLLFILAIGGCVTPRQTIIGQIDPSTKIEFPVKNTRPSIELKTEPLTTNPLSADYGITRIGDDAMSPNIVDYLIYRLQAGCGEKLRNKEVTVKNFTIYINFQDASKNDFIGMSGIPLGILDVAIIQKLKSKNTPYTQTKIETFDQFKELREGWFVLAENPSKSPSVIANIAIEVNNTIYFARQVKSWPAGRENKIDSNLVLAIDGAIDEIIQKVNSSL